MAGGAERRMKLNLVDLAGSEDQRDTQSSGSTLREAADQFGEAVFLSRFRNKGVEIIHVETPQDAARSFVHPGLGFRPMHACSCSKVIAAFAEDGFREEILNGPMRRYTPQTKHDPEALRAEFEDIRMTGYAECVEEIEVGVSSVAAPIRIGNIGATFSIGATGPVRRFTTRRRAEIGPGHVRALHAGTVEIGVAQIGFLQICAFKVRPPHARRDQLGAA